MTIYYSSNPRGFYLEGIHGSIPANAKLITREQHQALLDGQAQGKLIREDAEGNPVLVDPPPAIVTAVGLCSQIDEAADTARRAVAGDPLRAAEYEKAALEAQAFKDAGYPPASVPRTVAAWAINGRTAQQAADNILAEAAAYTEALYLIRETRLQAKESVRTLIAGGDTAAARLLTDQSVAAIQQAVAGVGNAGG